MRYHDLGTRKFIPVCIWLSLVIMLLYWNLFMDDYYYDWTSLETFQWIHITNKQQNIFSFFWLNTILCGIHNDSKISRRLLPHILLNNPIIQSEFPSWDIESRIHLILLILFTPPALYSTLKERKERFDQFLSFDWLWWLGSLLETLTAFSIHSGFLFFLVLLVG